MAELLGIDTAVSLRRYLLLDTCLLIEEFHRRSSVLSQIPREQRRTSIVALWEFFHGKEGSTLPHDIRRSRRVWLDGQAIRPVEFSPRCSRTFHSLLWRDEAPPGVVDCLIAAESLARTWPLVTSNVRHFESVRGLKLVPV